MDTISAAEFKTKCLAYLDTVGPEGLIITKHGRPVAKLIAVPRAHGEWIGALKDELKIRGKILSTGVRWNAES